MKYNIRLGFEAEEYENICNYEQLMSELYILINGDSNDVFITKKNSF